MTDDCAEIELETRLIPAVATLRSALSRTKFAFIGESARSKRPSAVLQRTSFAGRTDGRTSITRNFKLSKPLSRHSENPMREHKKKPGDMQRARKRHLRKQELQDAISAVKRGENPEIEFSGKRWRLRANEPLSVYPTLGICLIRGKRLVLGWICEKDGIFMDVPGHGRVHVWDKILALATEIPENVPCTT